METTVAFTGHQNYDGQAAQMLSETIRALCAAGYDTFLTGMARGFDLAAAETVLSLRTEFPALKLVAVIPFAGQDENFPVADRVRYHAILQAVDRTVTLAESYARGTYYRRNDYLVDHAGKVVAWYTRHQSGTGYTVRHARQRGVEVINLADPTLF